MHYILTAAAAKPIGLCSIICLQQCLLTAMEQSGIETTSMQCDRDSDCKIFRNHRQPGMVNAYFSSCYCREISNTTYNLCCQGIALGMDQRILGHASILSCKTLWTL